MTLTSDFSILHGRRVQSYMLPDFLQRFRDLLENTAATQSLHMTKAEQKHFLESWFNGVPLPLLTFARVDGQDTLLGNCQQALMLYHTFFPRVSDDQIRWAISPDGIVEFTAGENQIPVSALLNTLAFLRWARNCDEATERLGNEVANFLMDSFFVFTKRLDDMTADQADQWVQRWEQGIF